MFGLSQNLGSKYFCLIHERALHSNIKRIHLSVYIKKGVFLKLVWIIRNDATLTQQYAHAATQQYTHAPLLQLTTNLQIIVNLFFAPLSIFITCIVFFPRVKSISFVLLVAPCVTSGEVDVFSQF